MSTKAVPAVEQSNACTWCKHAGWTRAGNRACFNPGSMNEGERGAYGPQATGWGGRLIHHARERHEPCGPEGRLFEQRLPDVPQTNEQRPTLMQRIARWFA